jgi:hypothetical protein
VRPLDGVGGSFSISARRMLVSGRGQHAVNAVCPGLSQAGSSECSARMIVGSGCAGRPPFPAGGRRRFPSRLGRLREERWPRAVDMSVFPPVGLSKGDELLVSATERASEGRLGPKRVWLPHVTHP